MRRPSDKLNIAAVGVGGIGRSYLKGCDSENIVALARVQRRLASFSGRQTHPGNSQNPVAWVDGRKETESCKPFDKAILGMVSESLGRNESVRRGSLENYELRKPSFCSASEGSMGRRKLTDAACHSGGVIATAR